MTDAAVVLSLRYVPINTEKDASQTTKEGLKSIQHNRYIVPHKPGIVTLE